MRKRKKLTNGDDSLFYLSLAVVLGIILTGVLLALVSMTM